MKKMLLPLLLLLCVCSRAQMKFGLTAGINAANLKEVINQSWINHSFLPRLNLGITAAYPLDERWQLGSGLLYAGKGCRILNPLNGKDTTRIRLHYLEVPVNIGYKVYKNENTLTASSGIYAAYGFAGKIIHYEQRIREEEAFGPDGDFKRFDLGYQIGSAYHFRNNYGVKAQFSHSLITIGKGGDKAKNYVFSLSFLLLLNRKR